MTSILDIGCGPGQVAALLRDQGVTRYLGLDFSPARIRQARAVCPEFEFVLADVFKSDVLRAHDYDAVVCSEFLEHVQRDLDVVASIRPGTNCFITVPSYGAPQHVRFFSSRQEVAERYAPFFEQFAVTEHRTNADGAIIFIAEGVRRAPSL